MKKAALLLLFLVLVAAALCWPSFQNPCPWGRSIAASRSHDQDTLAEVAVKDADAGVRETAIQGLRLSPQADFALLGRVAKVADNEKVRAAAALPMEYLQAAQVAAHVATQFAVWQAANPNWTGADLVAHLAAATGIKLVRIAPGEFTMGSANGDSDEKPAHQVIISRPFFLGTTELTQAQWTAVMGDNPSTFTGDTSPVERVSYGDALSFCKKLTERERMAGRLPAGWVFTMPTEAQWEYACRAGTKGDFAGDLDEMAWYDSKGGGHGTKPVGTKKANAWGLFDMHGNVSEWCVDWYAEYPKKAVTDPSGAPSGSVRVCRGGASGSGAAYCRAANRGYRGPGDRSYALGLRLALSFSP